MAERVRFASAQDNPLIRQAFQQPTASLGVAVEGSSCNCKVDTHWGNLGQISNAPEVATMPAQLTRHELYDLVWSKPVTQDDCRATRVLLDGTRSLAAS